jgi:hypothetical protein
MDAMVEGLDEGILGYDSVGGLTHRWSMIDGQVVLASTLNILGISQSKESLRIQQLVDLLDDIESVSR